MATLIQFFTLSGTEKCECLTRLSLLKVHHCVKTDPSPRLVLTFCSALQNTSGVPLLDVTNLSITTISCVLFVVAVGVQESRALLLAFLSNSDSENVGVSLQLGAFFRLHFPPFHYLYITVLCILHIFLWLQETTTSKLATYTLKIASNYECKHASSANLIIVAPYQWSIV